MTNPDPAAHMQHAGVQAAQDAFDDHMHQCETCQSASNYRGACAEGQRLHDAVVEAAHRAREESERG